jgi:hypothetical protein
LLFVFALGRRFRMPPFTAGKQGIRKRRPSQKEKQKKKAALLRGRLSSYSAKV